MYLEYFNQEIAKPVLLISTTSVNHKVYSLCCIDLVVESSNIEVATILGTRACPILVEGRKEERKLR